MKIIEPSVKYMPMYTDKNKFVADCAKVCYGKEEVDDKRLINVLLNKKHHSMFRHASYYFIVPVNENFGLLDDIYRLTNTEHILIVGIDIKLVDGCYFIVMNGHFAIDHSNLFVAIRNFEVSYTDFADNEETAEMIRYTFKVETQISTSRELNRVSPNNIAEASTRYIHTDGAIVRPHWMNVYSDNKYNSDMYDNGNLRDYLRQCEDAFAQYHALINNGMKTQDARGVLPLDTHTTCVYTYSKSEWKHIIDLRFYETTGPAHPNAKIIGGKINNQLKNI